MSSKKLYSSFLLLIDKLKAFFYNIRYYVILGKDYAEDVS